MTGPVSSRLRAGLADVRVARSRGAVHRTADLVPLRDAVKSPQLRVLVFAAVLATAGVAGAMALLPTLPAVDNPVRIPWIVFAGAFFLAETKVIPVPFRRDTHSFSLSELATVVGLFFVEPNLYLLGVLVGGLSALLLAKQPPLRLGFNIALFLASGVATLAVFYAIGEFGGAPGPREWLAAFAAAVVGTGISTVAVAAVITITNAAPQLQKLPEMLQVSTLFAVTNTSLALLAVAIVWVNPLAIWLLVIPVTTLFVSYRAYLSERRKHESLEMLYESSRIFQRSAELDSAILAMLENARNVFRSDRAEIVLLRPNQPPLRSAVGPGDLVETMQTAEDREDIVTRMRAEPQPFLYVPSETMPTLGPRMFRHAMAAPLTVESGLIGVLLIADRLGEVDAYTADELRLLETIGNQAAFALENGQLEQSLAELVRLKEKLHHQAHHDALTNLPNRTLFIDQLRARLVASPGDSAPVVLFLDLDDFKIVNDTLGHATGDVLLCEVANRIRATTREGDLSARLGGDEFGVLIADDQTLEHARALAKRLIAALRAPFALGERGIVVGVSIGIARAEPDQTADELLRNADVAMYTSKGRGKGQVSVFSTEMHAAIIERHELSAELSTAVARDELDVSYQPIVALDTGRIVSVEALARWHHPTKGMVPPTAFIPLAEESGTILALGRRVLERACADAARWGAAGGATRDVRVTVNLSPHQVLQPDFIEDVRSVLESTGLPPTRLVLELTESAIFNDLDGTIVKLGQLRALGVTIALDDFGTGYSSLGYLRRFPIQILKIAREFISGTDSDDWTFADAIVALGRTLGLQLVAEGIEDERQVSRLRALGCDLGQGFLFSRPIAVGALPGLAAAFEQTATGTASRDVPVPEAPVRGRPVPTLEGSRRRTR